MSDLKASTAKALAVYGYTESNIDGMDGRTFIRPKAGGFAWVWDGESFRYYTSLMGVWYGIPNHFDDRFEPGKMGARSKDHSHYEHPECWIWEFPEYEVRQSYQAAAAARERWNATPVEPAED